MKHLTRPTGVKLRACGRRLLRRRVELSASRVSLRGSGGLSKYRSRKAHAHTCIHAHAHVHAHVHAHAHAQVHAHVTWGSLLLKWGTLGSNLLKCS